MANTLDRDTLALEYVKCLQSIEDQRKQLNTLMNKTRERFLELGLNVYNVEKALREVQDDKIFDMTQKRRLESVKDKKYMNNGDRHKWVHKNFIEQHLDNGWILGRIVNKESNEDS